MTLLVSKLLYLAPLVTYTFGALTFAILALFYWRERSVRRVSGRGRVFAAFTLVCFGAFLTSLLRVIGEARIADQRWATVCIIMLDVLAALIPPVLLHVIYDEERSGLPARFSKLLAVFYAICLGAGLARVLDDSEWFAMDWSAWLDRIPALTLAASAAMGLLVNGFSRRIRKPGEKRQSMWTGIVMGMLLAFASATVFQPAPWWNLLPDYAVLGFFCVTLYYQERLVFFDLLIKRGAFFALSFVGLTLFFLLVRQPQDWSQPWIAALLLVPLWLMSPWIYARLERTIDRVWLHRRYSAAEAERQFIHDVQRAATTGELRTRAAASLSEIFRASAEVLFVSGTSPPSDPDDGLVEALEHGGANRGWIALSPRLTAIPFLSDERRLLKSLARILGVMAENVGYREQQEQRQERERQLRLLTSRAELKALRAQINPHFLFNALNAIAGLIPNQPELADETIERLAEVFRYTLRSSEREWVSLSEEVEFVCAYLRVEHARFGDRQRFEIEVDPAAASIPIPAMTIQPLIENAIKHGLSAREKCGVVGLGAVLRDNMLCIEVFDNGPGFPKDFTLERTEGYGLRNVADRLAGYYGGAARLHWESAANLTRVFLTLPYHAGAAVKESGA